MTPRKKILVLAAVLLVCGVVMWRGGDRAPASHQPVATTRVSAGGFARVIEERASPQAEEESVVEPRLTRAAATQCVRALYRKEQLTREFDLEQQRYGRNYWESPRDGRELEKLARERAAMLTQLNAEANQVLNEFFPGEVGEPVVLTAFFDAGVAGPNLSFLLPATRVRFEAEILAGEAEGGVDPEHLRVIAERVLSATDLATYRQWNDADAMALRAQLIGFTPSEHEFTAVLRERRLSAETGEAPASSALEALLGVDRFAALQKLQAPAVHAALSDLQRLGLPLEQAEWLAATRTRAVADIGQIWNSTALTDAAKREQVTQVEQAYGRAIAARLGLAEAALDGLAPGS